MGTISSDSDLLESLKKSGDINVNINDEQKEIEFIVRITKSCNEQCLFCNTHLDKSKIELEEVEMLADYCKQTFQDYSLIFCISGGEPTIHKDFIAIIGALYSKGFSIKIQTNATIFSSKEFLKKLLPYKDALRFFVSFHSHIPKTYEQITGTKLYPSALRGILHLYELFDAEQIELNFVMNVLNYKSYREYLEFLKKYIAQGKRKVRLIFSVIYPNKDVHKKLLIEYNAAVNAINSSLDIRDEFLSISYEVGGYCQLPLCFFQQLHLSKEEINFVGVDYAVGMENMQKAAVCKECTYYQRCVGLPSRYLERFGEEDIRPIY